MYIRSFYHVSPAAVYYDFLNYEQISLYRESLYLGDSLAAEKGLAQAYDDAGRWADAGELVESLLREYTSDTCREEPYLMQQLKAARQQFAARLEELLLQTQYEPLKDHTWWN